MPLQFVLPTTPVTVGVRAPPKPPTPPPAVTVPVTGRVRPFPFTPAETSSAPPSPSPPPTPKSTDGPANPDIFCVVESEPWTPPTAPAPTTIPGTFAPRLPAKPTFPWGSATNWPLRLIETPNILIPKPALPPIPMPAVSPVAFATPPTVPPIAHSNC